MRMCDACGKPIKGGTWYQPKILTMAGTESLGLTHAVLMPQYRQAEKRCLEIWLHLQKRRNKNGKRS